MRTFVIWLVGILISFSIDGVAKAIDRNTKAIEAAHGSKGET